MHPLVEQTIRSMGRGTRGEPAFSGAALCGIQHGLARCVGTADYAPVLDALIKLACSLRQEEGADGAAKALLQALSAVVEISHAHGQAPDASLAQAWQAELL
jgi:hypothetical protein